MLVGTDSDLSISWLIGTLVYEKLCEALSNKALVRGIKQASPHAQTSCLEGFHSVLNHFAPKMIAYSYVGMYCRYKWFIVFLFLYDGDSSCTILLSGIWYGYYQKALFYNQNKGLQIHIIFGQKKVKGS